MAGYSWNDGLARVGHVAVTGETWDVARARIQAGQSDDPPTEYALAWLTPLEHEKLAKGMATTERIVEQLRNEYRLVVAPALGLPVTPRRTKRRKAG